MAWNCTQRVAMARLRFSWLGWHFLPHDSVWVGCIVCPQFAVNKKNAATLTLKIAADKFYTDSNGHVLGNWFSTHNINVWCFENDFWTAFVVVQWTRLLQRSHISSRAIWRFARPNQLDGFLLTLIIQRGWHLAITRDYAYENCAPTTSISNLTSKKERLEILIPQ